MCTCMYVLKRGGVKRMNICNVVNMYVCAHLYVSVCIFVNVYGAAYVYM